MDSTYHDFFSGFRNAADFVTVALEYLSQLMHLSVKKVQVLLMSHW